MGSLSKEHLCLRRLWEKYIFYRQREYSREVLIQIFLSVSVIFLHLMMCNLQEHRLHLL